MDDLKQLKLVKNIYIVMSLLFCVLGIFLMARPKSSVKMLCVLMGSCRRACGGGADQQGGRRFRNGSGR